MVTDWVLSKLEEVENSPNIVLRDPLQLLPKVAPKIHEFAINNGFTVIVAATNLVFRDIYERTMADKEAKKIFLLDRTPKSRQQHKSTSKAPPPFYPDLLSRTPTAAHIELNLRQFFRETTQDSEWPEKVNDPRYARIIVKNLDAVLRAYRNLRAAHPTRFTDYDLGTIIAYAALGIPEAAFKKMEATDFWKIALIGHEALGELDSIDPSLTEPVKRDLKKAPAPFCWFADHDEELVLKSFYLSLILSQHLDNWNLLLANVDPHLSPLSGIKEEVLKQSGPKVIELDPRQADKDMAGIERSIDSNALEFLLEQLKIEQPAGFRDVVLKERYSVLLRSLAVFAALRNLLGPEPSWEELAQVKGVIMPDDGPSELCFADNRVSVEWAQLKEAYLRACEILKLLGELGIALKTLDVTKPEDLSFGLFRKIWVEKRVNRLEYYLSCLERIIDTGELIPRSLDTLPRSFAEAKKGIRKGVRKLREDVNRQLNLLNSIFQDVVRDQYPLWTRDDSDVILTSQFIRRCLKPHWDPKKEKAALFIFDGMRYDVWEEFLKPLTAERMEIIEDLPASSLLPSETNISRKAISANAFPDEFDMTKGEDKLLKQALAKEFNYTGPVEENPPEGAGTAETVRYQAGNLEVYIFELCDKELHNIEIKTTSDKKEYPSKPISIIYGQTIRNILETEVMAIMRQLTPGTKVFITADHGFGVVGRQPLYFEDSYLNEVSDCKYLNCLLREPIDKLDIPDKVRENIIAYEPRQIRMLVQEKKVVKKTGATIVKRYGAVAFPRVGYSFGRKGFHYKPGAFSHGGISIQEMMIPMVVLRVRPPEEGLIALDAIEGPEEILEGVVAEFSMHVNCLVPPAKMLEELRLDISASYGTEPSGVMLPDQVKYMSPAGTDIRYSFIPEPDEASAEERKQGMMRRKLTITISYKEGKKSVKVSREFEFAVRLNPDRLIRRYGNLGGILGLTPKTMR